MSYPSWSAPPPGVEAAEGAAVHWGAVKVVVGGNREVLGGQGGPDPGGVLEAVGAPVQCPERHGSAGGGADGVAGEALHGAGALLQAGLGDHHAVASAESVGPAG
ncbi:hypothetical protein ACFSYA_10100 [Dietzia aerolata]|uniref:Uncharacterized protein n=1 Tax=Dietzia aerolata TaxID=595984 RepID=A0ABV5JQ32_9ACTN